MKIQHLLVAVLALSLGSCLYSDKTGRKWVTVRLPRDPLREAIIDRPIERATQRKWEREEAAKRTTYVPTPPISSWNEVPHELPPPPPDYMFSSHMITSHRYEIRGVTGPVVKMSARDYKEFADQCRESQWMIYQF